MNTQSICDTIRMAIKLEAGKEGGPSTDNQTMVLSGTISKEDDPELYAVLLAKGKLVIEVQGLLAEVESVDNADFRRQMRELAAENGVQAPALTGG